MGRPSLSCAVVGYRKSSWLPASPLPCIIYDLELYRTGWVYLPSDDIKGTGPPLRKGLKNDQAQGPKMCPAMDSGLGDHGVAGDGRIAAVAGQPGSRCE